LKLVSIGPRLIVAGALRLSGGNALMMRVKDCILGALERAANLPLARPLSSRLLTSWCSSLLRRRVRIFYDESWLRNDGSLTIALGPRFYARRTVILAWKPDLAEIVERVAACWFTSHNPKPGDVIVDIGAGMGEDALLFSRSVGERGAVYCFEAHPATARCLRKTLHYSRLSNVVAVEGAVFSRRASIQIKDSEAWQENSIMAPSGGTSGRSFSVSAFPLDEYEPLLKCPRIDFMKMNIEGAETEALRGMPHTLRKVSRVCVCCHDFMSDGNPNMKTKAECRRILSEAGFSVYDNVAAGPPWERDHLHGFRESAGG
jgi:FkbM family methyltransferase